MPQLITESGQVATDKINPNKPSVKFWEGDNKENEDIGLKQVETRKILNYDDQMIKFINSAGSSTKSTDVHSTFRYPKEIFFTNTDLPKFGLEKQKTTLDTRTE